MFTQNRYFLTAVTLLNIRKDVIKTVYVHPLEIFPTFLLRMNVSRNLSYVPIEKINIAKTFKKRKLSKLCYILTFQVVLITTLKSLILLRK